VGALSETPPGYHEVRSINSEFPMQGMRQHKHANPESCPSFGLLHRGGRVASTNRARGTTHTSAVIRQLRERGDGPMGKVVNKNALPSRFWAGSKNGERHGVFRNVRALGPECSISLRFDAGDHSTINQSIGQTKQRSSWPITARVPLRP
jgi:hypothetical protein